MLPEHLIQGAPALAPPAPSMRGHHVSHPRRSPPGHGWLVAAWARLLLGACVLLCLCRTYTNWGRGGSIRASPHGWDMPSPHVTASFSPEGAVTG